MITKTHVGQKVTDGSGRVGLLRDVIKDWEDPAELPNERKKRTVAFVWPEGGGVEWMASPARLSPAWDSGRLSDDESDSSASRNGDAPDWDQP